MKKFATKPTKDPRNWAFCLGCRFAEGKNHYLFVAAIFAVQLRFVAMDEYGEIGLSYPASYFTNFTQHGVHGAMDKIVRPNICHRIFFAH